ncbi:MAG: zinc-binding alcohol dehydrogenase family protein [Chitinophagaceae bacterium]|nr:MAG: zinc-binding alcohol dehydrogenase family protein [Chitinophagaceae bacterium]
MKVLVCDEPGKFSYQQKSPPDAKTGDVIIRITHVGICGTDLHAFEGTQPFFSYPRILGHELAAVVEDPGGSTEFSKGDVVTTVPYYYCGSCIACRNGKTNCCTSLKVAGVHIDGGMQELYAVPSYSLVHAEGLNPELLALVEPLAIGAHGISRAQIKKDEQVLIFGAGPIGLAAIMFARHAGADVIVADVNDGRLAFCEKLTGVKKLLNVKDSEFENKLALFTNNEMAAVVIDATGSNKAINNAFKYIAHGGRYVLIGLQKQDIVFSHPEFHKREATLMSSRNATIDDFRFVINAIKSGTVDPSGMITHRVEFDELAKQFPGWLHPDAGVVKAMVRIS